jgi:hypothetical protein
MSIQYHASEFQTIAKQVERPNIRQDIDRSFQLPMRLYGATIGLYLAFLAVMAIGFQTREMILPMAIFVIYIVMAFGVPALWTKMRPENNSKALDWMSFQNDGIVTMTGQTKAWDATAQVLVLPVLIFFWGVATATIATIVS